MKALLTTVCLLTAALIAVPGNSDERLPMPREHQEMLPMPLEVSSVTEPAFTISGPHVHANLTIFLLHGKDLFDTRKILTLAEAMQQKKVVVHETSEVNLLSVENVSEDIDVFIQTGDIVKGGKQDRIMAFDMLVPAKSGKLPIPSFCCESGRWQQRGKEDDGRFALLAANANGRDFKLAVQGAQGGRGGQGEVWNKVREAQMRLAEKVGKPVTAAESGTSLQLTLEHKDLLAKLEAYEKALTKILEGKKNAIGFAVAINGKVEGAEVFGSAALFQKVWPRLLNAAAVDALASFEKEKKFEAVVAKDVEKFLAQIEEARGTEMRLAAESDRGGRQSGARGGQLANSSNGQQSAVTGQPSRPQAATDGVPLSLRLKHFQRDTGKTLIVESQEKGAILHRSYTAR
jgi:ARG and Rhodanese-Phosphatase-superfamily-associated Protein domain